MRWLGWVFLCSALVSSAASGADYEVLRNLRAGPPTQVVHLSLETKTQSVQFARVVFRPPQGEAWAVTLTKGIVSANRVYDGLPFIQSDVAVTHGNSGGPLLDEKGRVLGLTVSGRAPDGAPVGLNFFIPIDDALRALALKAAG